MRPAEDRWAELEWAPWRGVRLDLGAVTAEHERLAAAMPGIFRMQVDDGRVRIEPKPASGQADDAERARFFAGRAELYRAFLQAALHAFAIAGRGTLAVDVEDRGTRDFRVPVFAFQKPRGRPALLLPDVDLIGQHFLADPGYDDAVPFARKRPEAIFVGSTTGGVLDEEAVRTLANPRLRAAMFFKDRPGVIFSLPRIVQCSTPEVERQVRALGVSGPCRTWAEQTDYRYLLSMDGNGATCARVALALCGDGVLVKYMSPHLLYYFRGLEPWVHYIPVSRDADVLDVVSRASSTTDRDRAIADASRAFARRHLNERAALRYTAALLSAYLGLFGPVVPLPDDSSP